MARKSVLCDIEQSGAQGPATLAIDLNLESMQFRQPRRSMGGGNSPQAGKKRSCSICITNRRQAGNWRPSSCGRPEPPCAYSAAMNAPACRPKSQPFLSSSI